MKIILFISSISILSLADSFSQAQVGINTNTPQSIMEISSSNSALILSRNPTPTTNITTPIQGMTLYNTTQNALNVYDGSNWQQVIYYQSNEGIVKINSGASGAKPTFTITNANQSVFQTISYTLPLTYASSPTTSWPENNPTGDAYIYASSVNRFLENALLGQVHRWRIIVNFSGKANNTTALVTIQFSNPLSSFLLQDNKNAFRGATSGVIVFEFTTVADGASLPPPNGTGNGYLFQITSDTNMTLVVDSVTRISNKKDS